MTKILNSIIVLSMFGWICFFPNMAAAGNAVGTKVRVIHASQGQNHIDSKLTDLAEELGSIPYSSYRLIKTKTMRLANKQNGVVKLPNDRSLVITLLKIGGEKITYQINIFHSGDQIFGTQILLKNNRSITIGRVKSKNGVLLFNISGKIL